MRSTSEQLNNTAASTYPDANGVIVTALGDLMLSGEWDAQGGSQELAQMFDSLRSQLGGDIVFANLETAVPGTEGFIEKEPRVVAADTTLRTVLEALNVKVVNLANNHSFDSRYSGFVRLSSMLEDMGIHYLGAGVNSRSAERAVLITMNEIQLGWLGYVAKDTDPSHVASTKTPGVSILDESKVLKSVAELKSKVDHVLVSLHWGIEYSRLPTPAQVNLARNLIDEGASAVIGHHPHVIQGVERYGNGVIAYSLGNATTTDFHIGSRLAIRQNQRTRSSIALRLQLSRDSITHWDCVPFRGDRAGILVPDPISRRYLDLAARRLSDGVSERKWRLYRFVENIVFEPLRKLHPSVVGSVRPRHLIKLLSGILEVVRPSR